MTLYDKLYAEVAKTLCHEDAHVLAANLDTMSTDEIRRLFAVVNLHRAEQFFARDLAKSEQDK